MAQLKDSKVDGRLEITGDLETAGEIIIKNASSRISHVDIESGDTDELISVNKYGDLLVGYDGYNKRSYNTHICGNDIKHFISADGEGVSYRPYYRAGDSIEFIVKTCGFVTASGTAVAFTIPISKPVIGTPTAVVHDSTGFILRQDGNYTHGSDGGSNPPKYVKAKSYYIEPNYNGGFVVTASFDEDTGTGSVTNNSHIGVVWEGTITLENRISKPITN